MQVFVWPCVEKATDSYHSEGGIVVFAETEDRARELANAESGCLLSTGELPTDVREVAGGTERVFIFPNAGCC